jgi:hypothetical protein
LLTHVRVSERGGDRALQETWGYGLDRVPERMRRYVVGSKEGSED